MIKFANKNKRPLVAILQNLSAASGARCVFITATHVSSLLSQKAAF